MSIKNRYEIANKYYKNYVILILIKRKLYIYQDNKLVDFKYINKLKESHINYIIIDNLEIYKKEYSDNKYQEYYIKYKLNIILENILEKYRERIDTKWKEKL